MSLKKIAEKAGLPLLYGAITGIIFSRVIARITALNGFTMTVLGVSIALLLASVACFMISPISRPGSGAGTPPEPGSGTGNSAGNNGPVPPSDGVHSAGPQDPVPAWIYAAGGAASIIGAILFFVFGMSSFNYFTIAGLVLLIGGILFSVSGKFLFSDTIARHNMTCKGLGIFSFFLMMGGAILGILVYVGAFDQGEGGPWGVLAAALFIAGACAYYYSETRRKDDESLSIGRDLGFKTTATSGSEARYDSKGIINGIEVLINLEQGEPHKNSPASFTLEILCRCRNTLGMRLAVKPEGPLGIAVGALPRVPDVPYWDFYDIRCDQPQEALRLLPDARRGDNVFTEDSGFRSLGLKGGEFKFVFGLEGYAGTAYVRRVAEEVSRLAARFA